MSSSVFEGYEKEYNEYSGSITRKIGTIATLAGEARKAKLTEVEGDIAEAEALVRRMDLEARSLSAAVKTPLLAKLRDYKAELNNLKKEVKKTGSAEEAARNELLGRAGLGDEMGTSAAQRQRLLSATDRLQHTGDMIEEGKRVINETEDIGVSILRDLHKQKETILSARETVHETDDFISKSRKVLGTMTRRMMANKIVMGVVVAMLLAAIAVVIYFKTHQTKSN